MANSAPTVFITAATERQGGALAHLLSGLNWNVKATVRSLEIPSAKALHDAGVQLTVGDWDNDEALIKALGGCEMLFLSISPQVENMDQERRQAEKIIKIAKVAGVNQVVVSTTLEVPGYIQTDNPYQAELLNNATIAIEHTVQAAGFGSWTILRPALLLPNSLALGRDKFLSNIRLESGFRTSVKPESKLAILDSDLISKIVVAAFRNPERYHERTLGLSTDVTSYL